MFLNYYYYTYHPRRLWVLCGTVPLSGISLSGGKDPNLHFIVVDRLFFKYSVHARSNEPNNKLLLPDTPNNTYYSTLLLPPSPLHGQQSIIAAPLGNTLPSGLGILLIRKGRVFVPDSSELHPGRLSKGNVPELLKELPQQLCIIQLIPGGGWPSLGPDTCSTTSRAGGGQMRDLFLLPGWRVCQGLTDPYIVAKGITCPSLTSISSICVSGSLSAN